MSDTQTGEHTNNGKTPGPRKASGKKAAGKAAAPKKAAAPVEEPDAPTAPARKKRRTRAQIDAANKRKEARMAAQTTPPGTPGLRPASIAAGTPPAALAALVQALPKAGTTFPQPQRDAWKQAIASAIDYIYPLDQAA